MIIRTIPGKQRHLRIRRTQATLHITVIFTSAFPFFVYLAKNACLRVRNSHSIVDGMAWYLRQTSLNTGGGYLYVLILLEDVKHSHPLALVFNL